MLYFLKHGKVKEQPPECADMLDKAFCCSMSEWKHLLFFRKCLLTEHHLEKSMFNFSVKEKSSHSVSPAHGGVQLRTTTTPFPSEIKTNVIPVDLEGLVSTLKTRITLRFSFSKHWSRKACSVDWGTRSKLCSLLLKMAFCQNPPIYARYIFSLCLIIFKLFYSENVFTSIFTLFCAVTFSAVY